MARSRAASAQQNAKQPIIGDQHQDRQGAEHHCAAMPMR
jgi:hypothetical protein